MLTVKRLRARSRSERGASLVEYALLVALIAVVCIGAVTFLGNSNKDTMQKGGDGINSSDAPVEETTTTEAMTSCQDMGPDYFGTDQPGRLIFVNGEPSHTEHGTCAEL